jgi:hypothetical protein
MNQQLFAAEIFQWQRWRARAIMAFPGQLLLPLGSYRGWVRVA